MTNEKRTVTCIPVKEVAYHNVRRILPKKKRVAAYCRVSTDEEDQQTSFDAQVAYYTQLITNNPDWVLIGIFADEGISGTRTKNRTEFLRLMQLCEEGKVDVILVKSISRFARNTLDTLNYVRKLKEKGIAIIFEKENINTLDISSEMILTLYSSFAQAESESISKNITWALQKEYKQGKLRRGCKILGFDVNKAGEWKIVPQEARIVQLIDMAFLSGMSLYQIKAMLEQRGIKTVKGNEKWQAGTIKRILLNEKYMGDVLLQKTFTVDMLEHKRKENKGELPQYYVKDHHPTIRSREVAYLIQAELAQRNAVKKKDSFHDVGQGRYSGQYALTELLICGDCGTPYRRVTWAKKGKKKVVWRCINRLKNGLKYCRQSPTLEETDLHEAILWAINQYVQNQEELKWLLKEGIRKAEKFVPTQDTEKIDEKIQKIEQSILDLSELLSMTSADLDYFDQKFQELENELKQLYSEKQNSQVAERIGADREHIDEELIEIIEQMNFDLSNYNDMLVRKIIQRITVLQKDKIEVMFMDGRRVEALVRV